MNLSTQPSPPASPASSPETACRDCPLRPLKLFHEPTGEELELVQSLKRRERRLGAGESLIHEGQTDAPLYTLLQGWAFRYKTLSDGRRQILSFLLPGDFIGVQQKMSDAAAHGVEALTESLFCVFQRDRITGVQISGYTVQTEDFSGHLKASDLVSPVLGADAGLEKPGADGKQRRELFAIAV